MAKTKTTAELKPIGDKLIIKPNEEENVSEGGIIIPDMEKQQTLKGEVVAVGVGRISDNGALIPMQSKKGDSVLYQKFAATVVEIDGDEYHTIREQDLVCILS